MKKIFLLIVFLSGLTYCQTDTTSKYLSDLPATVTIDSTYIFVTESPTNTYKLTWKNFRKAIFEKDNIFTKRNEFIGAVRITGRDTAKQDYVYSKTVGSTRHLYWRRTDGLAIALDSANGISSYDVDSLIGIAKTEMLDSINVAEDTLYAAINLKASIIQLGDVADTASAQITLEAGNRISQDSTLFAQIDLRVKADSLISYINLSPEVITISSDRIQIDGSTTFGSGYDPSTKEDSTGVVTIIDGRVTADYVNTFVLIADSILVGSVTAEKLSVDSLSAITANLGTLTAGTINASTVNVINLNAGNLTTGIIDTVLIADHTISYKKLTIDSLSAISANIGNVTAGSLTGVNITGGTFISPVYVGETLTKSITIANSSIDWYINGVGTLGLDIINDDYDNVSIELSGGGIYAPYLFSNGELVATQNYVTGLGYKDSTWIINNGYAIDSVKYATRYWVGQQGYVTGTPWTSAGYTTTDDVQDIIDANSAGFLTSESDPTIYAWAKAATKPSYTYSEVGAQVAGTYVTTETDPTIYSWAKAATKPSYTYSEVGALPSSGAGDIYTHNASEFVTGTPWTSVGYMINPGDANGFLHNNGFGTLGFSSIQYTDLENIVGTSSGELAEGNHTHSGVYLPTSGAGDIYTHNASEFQAAFTGTSDTITIEDNQGVDWVLTFTNGVLTNIAH